MHNDAHPAKRRARTARAASIAVLALLLGACAATGLENPMTASAAAPSAAVAAIEAAAATQNDRATGDTPSDITSKAVPVEGSEFVRARAATVVDAPLDVVRETVLAFEEWPEFMPEYGECRVLGRTPGGGRHVYHEVWVLKGALRFWAVIHMPKPTIMDGVETYGGTFEQGNVGDFQSEWSMRAIDGGRTELTLVLFLVPPLVLPTSWMNEKSVEAATKAMAAMRQRAEDARDSRQGG